MNKTESYYYVTDFCFLHKFTHQNYFEYKTADCEITANNLRMKGLLRAERLNYYSSVRRGKLLSPVLSAVGHKILGQKVVRPCFYVSCVKE